MISLIMKFKVIKYFILVCAALVVSYSAYFAYEFRQNQLLKIKELSFGVDEKWEWQDEVLRIQKRTDPYTNRTALRRVNLKEQYVVYVTKDNNYKYTTMVQFKTGCKPGTEIKTSKTFNDGSHKILRCINGGYLTFAAYWPGSEPLTQWSENLDGFSFYEYFMIWDMSQLDKEITLSKAE